MTTSSKKHSRLFRFLADFLRDRFVLPTKRLLLLALLGALLAMIGFAAGFGYAFFWVYNGLLLLASIIDWLTIAKKQRLTITATMPEQADIGQTIPVHIELHNESEQGIRYELVDDLPYSFAEAGPFRGKLEKGSAQIDYTTRATDRGRYFLHWVYLRWQGQIGLWQRQSRFACERAIKVYPDLTQVRGYLASLQDSLIVDGTKILRRARTGSDFHAIREYVPDDDPRTINWSASARSRRLMANQYRPEQGKVVTIMLDCGRLMGVELDGRTRLDTSLEAAVTLAAVALKQGDQVALLAYSHGIKTYIPPGRGLAHLHTLLEAVYDLRSDFVESDPMKALTYLHQQQKRRSLIVLFSDMENYLLEDQMSGYLWRLRRSHLLLLLSLSDPLLHAWSRVEAKNSRLAYVKALAQRFSLDRKSFQQKMTGAGIQVLDVPADQLTLQVVNAYLEIKSREAL